MSDLLAAAGVLVAAGASAAAILLPPGRVRSAAMLAAILLSPLLIAGDQWHSQQIADLRDHPTRTALMGAAALVAVTTLAVGFRRWPIALPLGIVFALPFRVPLEAGGDTANLLVPLYLVIAGGVLSVAARDWSVDRANAPAGGAGEGGSRTDSPARSAPLPRGRTRRPSAWLPRILAAVVVLYALQTLYSPDFSKPLQNVCFFFVPFSLVYALLRDVAWDRKLLAVALWVVAVEAVCFVLIGSVEYATRSLFWNDQVIRSNDFHTYFRVNSVFWDPNIYGRYLALAIVVAMAALLWARERRSVWLLTGLVAILWIGLVPTFSQSSFVALLAGLAVLAALRWSWRWTAATVGAGAVAAVLLVALAGDSTKIDFSRINIDTGGRANLVSGGAELFGQRPAYGYGSGSFPVAYKEQIASQDAPVSVSHTQPITIAAEQGLVGLAAYVALIVVALWTMLTGMRNPTPGRAAALAAFVALLVHTMAYAGFFEDPIAWVLLAVGASLASAPIRDSP